MPREQRERKQERELDLLLLAGERSQYALGPLTKRDGATVLAVQEMQSQLGTHVVADLVVQIGLHDRSQVPLLLDCPLLRPVGE